MSAPRIAANDPKLAHALMRHAVRVGEARAARILIDLLHGTSWSVPKLSQAIRRAYGPMVYAENIRRMHGERAAGAWIVLDSDADGAILPFYIARSRSRGIETYALRVRFAPHAVARLAQRTVGAADLSRVGPILSRHLHLTLCRASALDADGVSDFRTSCSEGAFLWRRHDDNRLVAATWLDAAGAADPQVRADCALTDEARGALRVVAFGAAP